MGKRWRLLHLWRKVPFKFPTRDEKGTTIVEAAFALPIFFLLMGGAVDVGYWLFENVQIANAARDGARVAMLDYKFSQACGTSFSSKTVISPTTCADEYAIQSMIASHIGGSGFSNATITCYYGAANPSTTTPCNDPCLPFNGEIEVTVTVPASYAFYVLPVFGSNLTRSSTLMIIGLPGDTSSCTT